MSPRKCRRTSSRFRPSWINANSASGTSISSERKKAFHACRCAGWLSTTTPSKSKMTASRQLIGLDLFSAPERILTSGNKVKLGGAVFILAKERIVHKNARSGKIKSKLHLLDSFGGKGLSHSFLVLFIAVQQHEA